MVDITCGECKGPMGEWDGTSRKILQCHTCGYSASVMPYMPIFPPQKSTVGAGIGKRRYEATAELWGKKVVCKIAIPKDARVIWVDAIIKERILFVKMKKKTRWKAKFCGGSEEKIIKKNRRVEKNIKFSRKMSGVTRVFDGYEYQEDFRQIITTDTTNIEVKAKKGEFAGGEIVFMVETEEVLDVEPGELDTF